jgi:hypothetical protein
MARAKRVVLKSIQLIIGLKRDVGLRNISKDDHTKKDFEKYNGIHWVTIFSVGAGMFWIGMIMSRVSVWKRESAWSASPKLFHDPNPQNRQNIHRILCLLGNTFVLAKFAGQLSEDRTTSLDTLRTPRATNIWK